MAIDAIEKCYQHTHMYTTKGGSNNKEAAAEQQKWRWGVVENN